MSFGYCAVAGCANRTGRKLCSKHQARLYEHGDVNEVGGRRHPITDEERAEVMRRLRRFESPKQIARDMGVPVSRIRTIEKEDSECHQQRNQ